MSGWNGSGAYIRDYNWINDRIAGIPITASRMQPDTQDMADKGFGNCLTRDGQGGPSNDLPMGGFKHTGVAAAVARTEYAQVAQVQDGTYNFKIGAGTGDAITADLSPAVVALPDGFTVTITAPGANTVTNPTFSPNGLTARTITKRGGSALVVGEYASGQRLILSYVASGTRWEMINAVPSSVPPTGNAGGDLAGTYPNPTLKNIGGAGVYSYPSSITLDANGRSVTIVSGHEPSGVLISSGPVSIGSADIVSQIVSGLSAYRRIEFQFENLTSSNTGAGGGIFSIRFSTDGGASYLSTAIYDQSGFLFADAAASAQASGATQISTRFVGNVPIITCVFSGLNTANVASVMMNGILTAPNPRVSEISGNSTATNVNAVQFLWTGTATSTGGTFRIIAYR